MSMEEFDNLDGIERINIIDYAERTFILRAINLPIKDEDDIRDLKKEGVKETKNQFVLTFPQKAIKKKIKEAYKKKDG